MKSYFVFFFYLLSFSLFATSLSAAQDYLVSGVVHDPTGALIPGASVEVRGTGSATVAASQTDEQGAFRIALPMAGAYQVEIRANGFLLYKAPAVVSSAAPVASLDVALAVEGNSLTVEVTADALAAETTSTQLGEELNAKKMQAVPLNGRSFTDLMAVQPGIVPQNTAQP
ncbi:MAG: carboxypeptidase-like regulatory domain-containing protein, partial [Terracidiphilus sp.]